jgi:hypothetical protein
MWSIQELAAAGSLSPSFEHSPKWKRDLMARRRSTTVCVQVFSFQFCSDKNTQAVLFELEQDFDKQRQLDALREKQQEFLDQTLKIQQERKQQEEKKLKEASEQLNRLRAELEEQKKQQELTQQQASAQQSAALQEGECRMLLHCF